MANESKHHRAIIVRMHNIYQFMALHELIERKKNMAKEKFCPCAVIKVASVISLRSVDDAV